MLQSRLYIRILFLSFIAALLITDLGLGFLPSPPTTSAQSPLPDAHLGYGLHLDPNVAVDPAMVSQLGMDWVKLYRIEQIAPFQSKRILFRQDMDIGLFNRDRPTFRAWLTERVAQLRDLGVDAIEIHNEPNLSLEWNNQPPDARAYVEILRVSYEVVKAVAPNMIVVSGGLAPTITTPDRMAVTDIDYARDMLRAGAGQWFDAFGYHPYGYNAPPEAAPAYGTLNFRRTELLWELMREFGISSKQIWLTEFGWLRDPAEDGITCDDNDPSFTGFAWLRVDGATQADYLARSFQYADRNWPWAGPMFIWNLNFSQRREDDPDLPMCSHMRWFGLLRRDGSPTLAFERVRTMPKRYSRYLPSMTLFADNMTLEASSFCPGRYQVGGFDVGNTGYPGSFIAQVNPARAPLGPAVEVSSESIRSGGRVQVFVNTANLPVGLHMIYVNVRTNIGGELRAQNVRGFVIIRDSAESC